MGVNGQRFPNRVRIHKQPVAIPPPSSISSAQSRHSLKKNGLYKVRNSFTVTAGDCLDWVGNDGERRMRWMRGHPVGWASVVVRSCSSFPPTYRFTFRTPGSGLLMRRICCADFTARVVSSDTSGPSETAGQTLPSSKSKVSAQKKRLNSTLERSVIPPHFWLTDPHFSRVISA